MRPVPSPVPRSLRWPALLAAALFALPLAGLALRTPWSRLISESMRPEVRTSLLLSLQSSLGAAGICLVLGLPLAAWLADGKSPLRTWVRALVLLPMVLPPVVGGLALLTAFGRSGILGAPLFALTGKALPCTPFAVILAEAYVAMPFFVLAVEGGLRTLDRRPIEAAATLGATPWRTFTTVTLPLLAPVLGAGLLVAWARALGEFGATITFAGNLEGSTRTLPLAVYSALESDPDGALVLGLVLVGCSLAVLIVLRKRWFPSS
ncbi:MAG: molybdate ABC transporter permease subunit [Planctomycetota bacterium]